VTRQFQRRTILVKRSLQLRYMALVLLAALAAAVIVGGGIYYTLARQILMDNPLFGPELSRVHHQIAAQVLIYLAIITILAAMISHRIAGPLYRFEQSARAFADGDLTHRVMLRSGDELTEMQRAFNDMAADLQTKVQKDRFLAKRIQTKLDALAAKLPDSRLQSEIDALKEEVGHLTKEFKV
jgi:methyl-accepting chemotaxis protein